MAAGDVVNGILSDSTFQPAVGVEVVITAYGSNQSGAAQAGLTGAAGTAHIYSSGNDGVGIGGLSLNMKFFINNTNYFRHPHATNAFYTGMQIK